MESDEIGQFIVGDLIDDALSKIGIHHLFLASLLIDGTVVARKVARIGEL